MAPYRAATDQTHVAVHVNVDTTLALRSNSTISIATSIDGSERACLRTCARVRIHMCTCARTHAYVHVHGRIYTRTHVVRSTSVHACRIQVAIATRTPEHASLLATRCCRCAGRRRGRSRGRSCRSASARSRGLLLGFDGDAGQHELEQGLELLWTGGVPHAAHPVEGKAPDAHPVSGGSLAPGERRRDNQNARFELH